MCAEVHAVNEIYAPRSFYSISNEFEEVLETF